MKLETKRIFISELPETATQEDITDGFSNYGEVKSVEIKERKGIESTNHSIFFAYVNLETDNKRLQQCFKDFANGKWRGEYVMLQVARESFLERLKREREEGSKVTGHTVKTNTDINSTNEVTKSKTSPKVSKSSSKVNGRLSDVVDHDDIETRHSKKQKKQSSISVESEQLCGETTLDSKSLDISCDVDFVVKTNKGKKHDRILKIPSLGNEPIVKIESQKTKTNNSEANLRRLQSLQNLKKGYQNQKSLIQSALSNVDTPRKNKIIFDDDTNVPMEKHKSNHDGAPKEKKLLFSDESEDEKFETNFEVKEQFQGKEGQKLLELQSKYKNDPRFKLDSRFLEHSEDQTEENYMNYDSEQINEADEMSLEEEKRKQYQILGEVLGKTVPQKANKINKPESQKKSMLRFDPSEPVHSKYEIPKVQKKEKQKKNESKLVLNEKKREEKEAPIVPKETFYKINRNIMDNLHDTEGFSLLNMFGQIDEKDKDIPEETPLIKTRNKKNTDANPFMYDSSDGEDETETIPNTDQQIQARTQNAENRINFWVEPFFFKEDDFRLQEGFDFIEKMRTEEKTEFRQLRRNLKEIVKAKVRNNQAKKKPFKRKLGGNKKRKMIRIKKALKK